MTISLRDALSLENLNESRVLAGEGGLDRMIRWVNILEVLDEISYLQEGELLVTTAYGFKNNPDLLEKIIPILSQRKLAGLAIQTGYYLEEIPQAIIEQCERYTLPLLELPKNISFVDLTKSILKRVINRQMELLEYSQKIRFHFTQVILKNEGLDQVAKILSELINAPIRIYNRDYTLLASHGINNDSPLINPEKIILEFNDYINKHRNITSPGTYPLPEGLFDNNKMPASQFIQPLIAGNEIHGYISVLSTGNDFNEMDLSALSAAATTSTLEILKNNAVKEAEERLKGDFLDDLLEEKYGSPETLRRRASYLGYDLSKSYSILCIDIDDFTNLVLSKDESELQEIKRRLLSLVRFYLKSHGWRSLIKYKSDKIIILLQVENGIHESKRILEITEKIRKSVRQELPITISVGVGQSYLGLTEIPVSFLEAKQAIYICKKLWKKDHILFYQDMGLYRLFANANNQKDLHGYYTETISAIIEYDKKHKSELIKTLDAFLKSNGGIKETAETLYIHRHTLKYRLNRIQEITHLNPEESQDRFQLQLGLIVAHLLGKI